MSGAKHTPGPWIAVDYHLSGACIYIRRSPGQPLDEVAVVYRYGRPESENSGNAQLIAAAPELTDALLMATENTPHHQTCDDGACRCWKAAAETALRKAGRLP